MMLRHKGRRRGLSLALLAAGGLMVWAVTPSAIGYALLGLGIALEIAGVLFEHRQED
ncbi:MAG: hypothetical protein JNM90_15150 [Burkholderiales bacterium]|nr:hypothetical protein [Burkholderiales bacterium]